MLNIEREPSRKQAERAPLKREAPLPLRGPVIRRRAPDVESPSKIDEIFKKSKELNKELSFDVNTGFQGGPSRRKGYKLAMWSLLASLIDGLILISLSCLFMLTFSLIVKTPVGSVLNLLSRGQHPLLFFLEIFFFVSWVYMIVVRSVMGSSIGEWACELRLGQPQERLKPVYVLRVAVRSSLILLTGVITLPLVSLVTGKDIAGLLSGLRLFSLK